MKMPRSVKVILWAIAALLLILALCVAVISTFNLNYAKPWINQRVSQTIDRPFAIEGNLSMNWVRPDTETGWRRWVPWPQINAEQITVGNPAPGQSEAAAPKVNMAEVKHLSVVLNPLPLLNKTVDIASLELETANVSLERQANGENNWTLKKSETPANWKFNIRKLTLHQAAVQVVDAASKLDLKGQLDSLKEKTSEGYGLGWKVTGSYNKASVTGEGQAGGVLALQNSSEPYPLQAGVKVGETTIAIEGSMTRPKALAALDVRLKLQGDSMADLFPLIGVVLPNTPPYSTEGHLIGTLDSGNNKWRYEDFKGKVGSSDLGGTLEFLAKKPRPILTGQVQSRLLRFQDLGPLIGADTSAKKAKDKPQVRQPADKALPVAPFHTDSWGKMDADVQFTGVQIISDKKLPLDNVRANIKLNDRVLTMEPLNFGVAGGDLKSNIKLNAQGPRIKANMDVSARHLKLEKLFPAVEKMKASLGELHGDAALTGEGNSVAALLGRSNGEVKAVISRGTISHFLMEAAGLNIANLVIVQLFGDEQVTLNCLASDFSVTNGLMKARAFQLDTEDAVIDISGTINLANERLALDVAPKNKTLRIFTLRSPLYVKGTFKHPDVGVYKGALAARAGGAVVLGIVATPFAAILPLLNMGTDKTDDCGPLLAAASKKPKAPPPEQASTATSPKKATARSGSASRSVPKAAPKTGSGRATEGAVSEPAAGAASGSAPKVAPDPGSGAAPKSTPQPRVEPAPRSAPKSRAEPAREPPPY